MEKAIEAHLVIIENLVIRYRTVVLNLFFVFTHEPLLLSNFFFFGGLPHNHSMKKKTYFFTDR